jgi:hypothetical protein
MSFFFSKPAAPAASSTFGYKITGNAGVPSDLENMKGSIVRTNKKYREEISKYREIARFNQQISNGYIKNLEAMVDVSRVLNYYIEIFNIIRDEFSKNEQVMGNTLKTADIGYLEKLTKSKVDELNGKFMVESEKLKKLYNDYGKTAEATRVSEAQQNLRLTTEGADQTLSAVKAIEEKGIAGGAKGKKTLPKFKKFVKPKQPKKKHT